ncbi:alanine--tRNA ligase [Litorimonas cladophorae]|uniref:Alanine--tRNA ligase n=1 Tax=Litorimonas cladophorae TaxID=1220491 RepID=A0A918NCL8_9PROT|nr:alanine--tRNA ligase [Litorimonas cladophorae]GGX57881.1 alanine--tRNA ligase [Litorimonas cladophorae]
MTSLADIRSQFLNFFDGAGHTIAPSSPLVPDNDPTLLFVNAGMVQFKDWFTGALSPDFPRAATSQKCVRAGGKHNDLDNVGYTARHHTFFEMLGNFSFGDYFKAEAIEHAWKLITEEFGLPKEKLLVTVYHTDDVAFDLWKKIAGLPDDRIIRIATDDNFWAMGETGPCGPCSEIFFDHGADIPGGPPGSPDEDGDRFIEIWNLVFMQYERRTDAGGKIVQIDLPKPSIDTGMGLERTAAILQGKHDNYDIDLFQTLIGASVDLTGVKPIGDAKFSHRVIADHLRSCSFLMADGVSPSNEGRGYVLRRIMRRAMRHAHLLGAKDPLMHRLVPTLVAEMGGAYNELKRAQANIEAVFEQEEVRFRRTLGRGTALLETATEGLQAGDKLDGRTAFKLYDTYGFPLDLTQDALRAKGIEVDQAEFDAAMSEQQEQSKADGGKFAGAGTEDVFKAVREASGPTAFTGYDHLTADHAIVALLQNDDSVDSAETGDIVFITRETPFYAESGGQAGDKGVATFENGARVEITDVQKRAGDLHAHIGTLSGSVKLGDIAHLAVDADNRERTKRNHSAAHLLHEGLRRVLGEHVAQKGQMVDGERIRFDISHGAAITREELAKVEDEVNAIIQQNVAAETKLMNPDEAIAAGAVALFGEKYGDEVRVLSLGNPLDDSPKAYSVELCGGTHVARTGDISLFKITGEGAVAAGIRRVEAVSGEAARQYLESQAGLTRQAADLFKSKPEDVPARIEALMADRKQLEKDLSEAKKQLALGGGGAASGPEDINGVKFLGRVLDGVSGKDLRSMLNEQLDQIGSGIVAFIARDGGKVAVAVAVSDDVQATHSASDLVNKGAAEVGGRGGGKAGMAQAGGTQPENAEAALEAIRAAI